MSLDVCREQAQKRLKRRILLLNRYLGRTAYDGFVASDLPGKAILTLNSQRLPDPVGTVVWYLSVTALSSIVPPWL